MSTRRWSPPRSTGLHDAFRLLLGCLPCRRWQKSMGKRCLLLRRVSANAILVPSGNCGTVRMLLDPRVVTASTAGRKSAYSRPRRARRNMANHPWCPAAGRRCHGRQAPEPIPNGEPGSFGLRSTIVASTCDWSHRWKIGGRYTMLNPSAAARQSRQRGLELPCTILSSPCAAPSERGKNCTMRRWNFGRSTRNRCGIHSRTRKPSRSGISMRALDIQLFRRRRDGRPGDSDFIGHSAWRGLQNLLVGRREFCRRSDGPTGEQLPRHFPARSTSSPTATLMAGHAARTDAVLQPSFEILSWRLTDTQSTSQGLKVTVVTDADPAWFSGPRPGFGRSSGGARLHDAGAAYRHGGAGPWVRPSMNTWAVTVNAPTSSGDTAAGGETMTFPNVGVDNGRRSLSDHLWYAAWPWSYDVCGPASCRLRLLLCWCARMRSLTAIPPIIEA